MTNDADSTTGQSSVKGLAAAALTVVTDDGLVVDAKREMDKVSDFLRRVMPAVAGPATQPVQALIPWACDVLQPKRSIEVYGQDIREFFRHMEGFGIDPLHVTADHVKLYKAALRDSGLAGATIARKMSVLRGVFHQFAVKKLISWETAQDIKAVGSPDVQKNTTPALTQARAVQLLHAPDPSTLQGLRDKALIHTYFITACRASALTRAQVGHMEFDGIEWYLRVVEKRQKRQRKILLEAARSLLAYIDAAGIATDAEGPLFRRFATDGRTLLRAPLSRVSVWRIVKKNCVIAGIPPDRLGARGIGVHSLRKSALNNAIENGATIVEARELAGHADIRTTELYFVRKEEDSERAARRIAIR